MLGFQNKVINLININNMMVIRRKVFSSPVKSWEEMHEENRWVSPFEKAQKEKEAAAEAREGVPSVVLPGHEEEWKDIQAESRQKEQRREMGKKAAVAGAATAAVGAAGYAAYKAWKKKQAKKKDAASQAENKFKK